jgi:hypothetical protein
MARPNLWSAPRIEEMAGGLRLLDMRFTGYAGRRARLHRRLARPRPASGWTWTLLGAVLFLSYRWLFPGWPGLIIGTVSLSSVVVDYLENAALAAMLRAGPDAMTPEMAAASMDDDEVELRRARPRDARHRPRLAVSPVTFRHPRGAVDAILNRTGADRAARDRLTRVFEKL